MQTRKHIPFLHILLRSAMTLVFLAVSWSIIPVKPVRAATIIVSNNSDSGAGSLRQAIADAAGGDTITFASSLSGQTILVASPLSISRNLMIDGSSLTVPITINGGSAVRVLGIGYTYTVTLKNLIIADGHNSSIGGGIASFGTLILEKCRFSNNYGGISGGGIYSEGTLSVTDSTFDVNSSFEGGGISMRSGTLTVTGSSFTGNDSVSEGGGIYISHSPSTISTSTFTNNTAHTGGAISNYNVLTLEKSILTGNSAREGGGIFNSGTITVRNSSFFNNIATGIGGGGIANRHSIGSTVTGSTFSGNTASGMGGGGLYSYYSPQTVTNSTFHGNSTTSSGGGIFSYRSDLTVTNNTFSGNIAGAGSGIYSIFVGSLSFSNNILANSSGGNDCFSDLDVPVTGGNNLVETRYGCGSPALTGDPVLGPLADNGGPTLTMALLSGSPAINTGNDASCAATDQRGIARPQGLHCDMGAYEVDTDAPIVAGDSLASRYKLGPSSFTITFSEPVNDPSGSNQTDDVTNPANYLLVEAGINASFDTLACGALLGAGGVKPDDTQVDVQSVTYDPVTFTATVDLGPTLPDGRYRLFVCGTTSIVDLAGNPLGGGTDAIINFVVGAVKTNLPETGFGQGKVTRLAAQPEERSYDSTGLRLDIPAIGVSATIAGVPKAGSNWDVSWLGNNVGYLEGTAFPTWEGNSVLTGHVWNADNTPGVFADLKMVSYGDKIVLSAWGQVYTYAVHENRSIWPAQSDLVMAHTDGPALTLVTCEDYDSRTGKYNLLRMVKAVLVSVE